MSEQTIQTRDKGKKCEVCGVRIRPKAKKCGACYAGYWWRPDELEFLRRSWGYLPVTEIRKVIDRSKQSICCMAFKLGLEKDREAGWCDNWKFISVNPYAVLTKTDRAYMAGIIDGEGTIDCPGPHRPQAWRISVGNTDKPLIDWLYAKVPYSIVHKNKLRKHWKQSWYWALCSNVKVFRLLQVLSPYLIVKKKKAIAALDNLYIKWRRLCELKGDAQAGDDASGQPAERSFHWSECPLFRDGNVRDAGTHSGEPKN